jgi:tRNA(adenine34) deaminase
MEFFTNEYWMREAVKEAKKAFDKNEVPVGCIIVSENCIIGRGHNLTEQLVDATAHAEIQAITAASSHIGAKYLKDCTMYVTLEPCTMCAGAIYWSQLGKLVWAASDEKRGFNKLNGSALHPKTQIESGILEAESSDLLKSFFLKLRTM